LIGFLAQLGLWLLWQYAAYPLQLAEFEWGLM
jgi:hypothetical protein